MNNICNITSLCSPVALMKLTSQLLFYRKSRFSRQCYITWSYQHYITALLTTVSCNNVIVPPRRHPHSSIGQFGPDASAMLGLPPATAIPAPSSGQWRRCGHVRLAGDASSRLIRVYEAFIVNCFYL